MATDKYERFTDLDFEAFRQMASDSSLSQYEKIGFPDDYREGFTAVILDDIRSKLLMLNKTNKTIVDVGPGCSELAIEMINYCEKQKHTLILIDSDEVLNHLPNANFLLKVPAKFPQECKDILTEYREKVDAVLCYSVYHYVFLDTGFYEFLDGCLKLLSQEGELFIGDIPNVSKRKRFFNSDVGKKSHKKFTGKNEDPIVTYDRIEEAKIDDSVVFSILQHARLSGFESYLLPQSSDLPMGNRREDILIKKY